MKFTCLNFHTVDNYTHSPDRYTNLCEDCRLIIAKYDHIFRYVVFSETHTIAKIILRFEERTIEAVFNYNENKIEIYKPFQLDHGKTPLFKFPLEKFDEEFLDNLVPRFKMCLTFQ